MDSALIDFLKKGLPQNISDRNGKKILCKSGENNGLKANSKYETDNRKLYNIQVMAYPSSTTTRK